MTTLHVESLTPESFARYGNLVTRPERSADATGPGWTWWAEIDELSGDGRAWAFGFLDLSPTPLRFDWAERHMNSTETVLATDGDLFLYVGPPDDLESPDRRPLLDEFQVFRVPAGSGVTMKEGVWHGAPFAAGDRTTALVLLLEGTGRDDVTVARFPDTPVSVERES
jgi:ureidoglycolate hydrolase